ncbi:hypothetical protein J0S82_008607, partial [Galemys pyrenaicus]
FAQLLFVFTSSSLLSIILKWEWELFKDLQNLFTIFKFSHMIELQCPVSQNGALQGGKMVLAAELPLAECEVGRYKCIIFYCIDGNNELNNNFISAHYCLKPTTVVAKATIPGFQRRSGSHCNSCVATLMSQSELC